MSEHTDNNLTERKAEKFDYESISTTICQKTLSPNLHAKSVLDKNEVNQKDNISDDLTSLEREIAEMHHMQLICPAVAQRVKDADEICAVDEDLASKKILLEIQPATRGPKNKSTFEISDEENNIENLKHTSSIKNEDLIALLKGTDQANDGDHSSTCEISEDVTIEGEGQFPILEVIDDIDDNELKNPIKDLKIIDRKILSTTNNPKQLTPEEERAVAMEQIAGLKSRGEKRRRKQDIVPLQLENIDLVTSLKAEWSDDESVAQKVTNKIVTKNTPTSDILQTNFIKQTNSSKIRSNTAINQNLDVKQFISKKSDQNGSDKTKHENKVEIVEKSVDKITSPSPTTGFKRTRIIKRKIIWDPDAPETQFSFANLVRSKKSVCLIDSKETGFKKSISLTSKVESVEKKRQRLQTSLAPTNVNKSIKLSIEETARESSSPKRRSQTPISNGAAGGKKKKISEIDRLMGDEGAINMLNALEIERHKMEAEENDNKPHKPLMRSRAANQSDKVNKTESTSTIPKKENVFPPIKTKRLSKSKASSSWDYVYQQQSNDESMIIRRRSNSSYSSSASQHRLSLDGPIIQKNNFKNSSTSIPETRKKNLDENSDLFEYKNELLGSNISSDNLYSSKQQLISEKTFEFVKPQSKSNQKQNPRTKSPVGFVKQSQTNENKEKIILEPKQEITKSSKATDVFLKKSAKIAQIIFNTQKAKQEYTFTIQMMNKLSEILKSLDQDVDCNVVVLLTTSPNFCQGIDLTDLITSTEEKRKSVARQLAKATKNYLKTLATFSKPLIAGVSGHVVGLGVTQLPLFDYVIASDKGTYETNYAKIGQFPEGFCFWNISGKVRANIRTKLFWLCEKIHSTDGVLSGFISKLVSSNKVNEEALAVARKIGAMPQQTFQETKRIINSQLNDILNALNNEFDLIANQWSSVECCENLKKMMEVNP